MRALPDIPICILAGGASQRFGSNKALAMLGEKPLIAHVTDRLRPQTSGTIAINTNSRQEFAVWEAPTVSDETWQGQGPLAGIFAALNWAKREGARQVVTTAVDLPFIPPNFVDALVKVGAPAIAMSGARLHPVYGLWDCSQVEALDQFLRSGSRSAHGWAEHCEAKIAEFPTPKEGYDPFFNINTPDDLETLENKLA